MKWILNHLKIVAAILVFGITAVVIGAVMLGSYNAYKDYERTYYENDLEVRSALAAAPKMVAVNDTYQAKYKYTFNANASDYNTDGTISLALYLNTKSFADIELVVNGKYTTNLLANMSIKVNDSLVEDDSVEFGTKPEEGEEAEVEEHHVVLSNFALPEGDFKVEISKLKNAEIGNINVYTSAKVALAE